MVSSSNRLPTTTDSLLKSRRMNQDLYGLSRLRITTKSQAPPSQSGVSPITSGGGGGTGSGLQTVGDTMIGPIAFFPVDADIVSDAIDISATGNQPSDFSTYVRLLPEGGTDDDLLTINGTAFSGQLLYLQGSANNIIDIQEGNAVNGGNILSQGVDLVLIGDQIITLLFDPAADTGDPLVQGAWRVVAGGSAVGRQLLFVALSADQTTNLTTGNHVEFDTELTNIGNLTLSTGAGQADGIVSGFITGRIYSIEYGIRMNGQGSASALAVRGRINDTTNEGTSANAITVSSNENASFLPTGFDVFIPNADTDTYRLEIVADDSVTTIEADSTYMTITSDVGGGASGGGGASILTQLNDVTITNPQTDEILQFNGSQWVNTLASAGQNQTPWLQNIDGDGFNLDMNINATRPFTNITNVKNIDFSFFNVSAIPKGRLNAETNRFEINVIDPADDFFLKSNDVPKFTYDASGDRLKSFVRLSTEGQPITDVSELRFRGNGVVASGFSQIFSDDLSGRMIFKVPDTFGFRWEEQSTSVPIMLLTPTTIDSTTFGNLQNVVRIELPNTSTAILPQTDGDIQQIQGDVFITSGGQPRNISDIGAGGQSDRIESPDTLTNIIATDGTLQMKISGTTRWTMNSVNLTLDRTLELGLNNIGSVQNILPNSNFSDIGSGSQFFGDIHTDRVLFENTANFIEGSSTGIEYNAISTGKHQFDLGATTIMSLLPDRMSMGKTIDMNNTDVIDVRDIVMFSSVSNLDMNGGDIIAVDDLTFSGSGSQINLLGGDVIGIDDMTFQGSGSFLNLNFGDIIDVDRCEVNGQFNHKGTTFGHYGVTPVVVPVMSRAQSSDSLGILIVRFQILQDILSQRLSSSSGNPSGTGIIELFGF